MAKLQVELCKSFGEPVLIHPICFLFGHKSSDEEELQCQRCGFTEDDYWSVQCLGYPNYSVFFPIIDWFRKKPRIALARIAYSLRCKFVFCSLCHKPEKLFGIEVIKKHNCVPF